jgi:hypothetical protein
MRTEVVEDFHLDDVREDPEQKAEGHEIDPSGDPEGCEGEANCGCDEE